MEHSRVIEWIQATAGQRAIAPAMSKNPKKQQSNKNKKENEDSAPAAASTGRCIVYCDV